jgi:hypothetical protein
MEGLSKRLFARLSQLPPGRRVLFPWRPQGRRPTGHIEVSAAFNIYCAAGWPEHTLHTDGSPERPGHHGK